MFKRIVFCIILFQFITSCNSDDDDGISYLSPEEQKELDTSAIALLLEKYYLNSAGDITAFISCDTDDDCNDESIIENTETPLKDLVQPLSNGAYYYIIEGKQGNGTTPDTNDSILLNYGVNYFKAYTSSGEVKLDHIGKMGTIYSGIEPVVRPSFYYYDFDAYAEATYGDQWDYYNANERQRILDYYNKNNIYERSVIAEFVEGIQKFKDRQGTVNSPLNVQGIIIAPSPNSKGLESYLSLGGISKDYILVFNIDLLSNNKVEDP